MPVDDFPEGFNGYSTKPTRKGCHITYNNEVLAHVMQMPGAQGMHVNRIKTYDSTRVNQNNINGVLSLATNPRNRYLATNSLNIVL